MVRRLGARRRGRCRTRSCCFKSMFSARTARVPPDPRRAASPASRCTSNTIAFFMGKQLERHWPQGQGRRIAAAEPPNYEFAMYRHASPVSERIAALQEAHRLGLWIYGMLCPLLPGIADDRATVRELLELCCRCEAEEVFVEPVNARGSGLRLMEEAFRGAGFAAEATAVGLVRNRRAWSAYCTNLLRTVQQEMEHLGISEKLRFLLYPTNLEPSDLASVHRNDHGVRWLGK
jgi:hypothetical protein